MGQPRKKTAKRPETHLQAVFIKRMKEELEKRQLSVLGFSKLEGAPRERTLADVLHAGAVPRLTLVHQCAVALNIPVISLLVDGPAASQETMTGKVHPLRPPPAKLLSPAKHRTQGQISKRNKSRD